VPGTAPGNSKPFVFESISPAIPPKNSIALVVWIVCLDRPNAAQGGRETGFRRHFRPIRGPFCAVPQRLLDPVNTNLKANTVLQTYPEDFGLKTTTNSVMIALGSKAILTASVFGRARNSDRISIRQHTAMVI
jgi:hypothetical protein